MKKIIIGVLMLMSFNLMSQSYSAWFKYGSSITKNPTEYVIEINKVKTQVYFYQNKYCYIQCRFDNEKAYWRRVYIHNKSKLIKRHK